MSTTTPPKFVEVFDGVLTDFICKALIQSHKVAEKERVDKGGYPTFTQNRVNVSNPEFVDPLVAVTKQTLDRYKECYELQSKYLPPLQSLEMFRIKCYNGGSDDRFDMHVDIASPQATKRALSFLYYLNDDFTGGETVFEEGYTVQPKTGSVLVFPPSWQFPHAGLPVGQGTKYIMSTYLHLV